MCSLDLVGDDPKLNDWIVDLLHASYRAEAWARTGSLLAVSLRIVLEKGTR
jgi:hypothetical protein